MPEFDSVQFNTQQAAEAAGYSPNQIEAVETETGYVWRPKQTGHKARRHMGPKRRAEAEAAAAKGILPAPPDFSAATHARFRGKLAKMIALAEAGDLAGLKAIEIKPYSSSRKALARYRDLCIAALEARAKLDAGAGIEPA